MTRTPRTRSHTSLIIAAVALAAGLSLSGKTNLLAPYARAQQTPAAAQTPTQPPAAQPTKLTPRLVATLADYAGPSEFGGRGALVAFSPDGRLVAVSASGRKVKLYETTAGKERATLTGDRLGVNGFAFSPDSKLAATRNIVDHSVKLWDAETGQERQTLAGRKHNAETKFKFTLLSIPAFIPVAFSPDGRAVLTEQEDDLVAAWEIASGKQVATFEHKTETNAARDVLKLAVPFSTYYPLIMSASFSPDGKRIATANGDKSPKLWDAETGKLVAAFGGFTDRVYVATFAPDSRTLLTMTTTGRVDLWDAATGASVATLAGDAGKTYAMNYSRDGKYVATQVDDVTTVWDAATGKARAAIRKNKARLLAFGADGFALATAGDSHAAAKVWDAATGQLKFALPAPEDDVHSVEFSPDGRLLLTTTDKGVRLWDAATGAPLATLERARYPTAFSPDGRLLATGGTDKTSMLYDLTAQ
jgi:WD40 repeat protein